jgi:hypothetical protein
MTYLNNTQEQQGTIDFIRNQFLLGFKPDISLAYHYSHPNEDGRILKETDFKGTKPDRYSLQTTESLWNVVTRDKYYDKIRSDFDCLEKDTGHIRNLFLKYFYGIPRPNQVWKYESPLFMFFHETNKGSGQFHTHVLLDSTGMITDNIIDIKDVLETSVRKRAKCISKKKDAYADYTTDFEASFVYLTKQVGSGFYGLDWTNSSFISESNVDLDIA